MAIAERPVAGGLAPPAAARAAPSTDVAGAFVYLSLRSARNRLVRQVRRMRSPRYVLALLFALAYFGFLFVNPGRDVAAPGLTGNDTAALVTTTAFALMTAWWWLAGSDRGALAFTPPEVQFLFTAPVSRRELVQFKLLRAQVLILVNILLWTLLLGRGPSGEMFWLRPISLWLLFSTLQLHRLGATLVRGAATEHGTAGLRRAWPPMLLAVAAAGLLVAGLARAWPAAGMTTPLELFAWLGEGLRTPPATWALLPFHLLTAPLFAATPAEWMRAAVPAAVLMLLNLLWVVRSDHAFEEAAFEASRRRARRLAVRRAGRPRRRAPTPLGRRALRLPPTGDPAVAIAWKNLLAAVRDDRFLTQMAILSLSMAALAVGARLMPEQLAEFAAVVLAGWGMLLVIAGPIWVRYDLRRDLPMLEVLRTYPVPGRRIVAAEIAASTIVLAILQAILAVTAFVALLGNRDVPLDGGERVAVLAATLLALPMLDALSVSIHNAAALLFPAWVHLGAERPAGIEAMGQLYLTMFASFLLLLLLLVPPALGGVAVAAALVDPIGWWSAVPAVVAASAVAAVELAVIATWLGGIFDRTEPSAVGVTA
ncbi:MAG TPA: putative ABC exporter domain-containing protein [Gemmatimonadaceae bacterium]|nr:putative ABC exporter domain-containing protein [Gemmatimonadaceae bacterium]